MTEFPSSVMKVAKAISVCEGFGLPNALPTRANNPGDVTTGDAGGFQISGVMNNEGVVRFVNLADGWQALYLKVARMLAGKSKVYPLTMTLEEMGRRYSGSTDGAWAKNLAEQLGLTLNSTIADLAQIQ
jgi:hypothetical protein